MERLGVETLHDAMLRIIYSSKYVGVHPIYYLGLSSMLERSQTRHSGSYCGACLAFSFTHSVQP